MMEDIEIRAYNQEEDAKNNFYNLKLNIIKTPTNVYVENNFIQNYSIDRYFFDKENLTPTFADKWFEIKQIPEQILYRYSNIHSLGYFIKDTSLIEKLNLPEVTTYEELENTYSGYFSLYEHKSENLDYYKEVNFTINFIVEIDNFNNLQIDPKFKVEYPILNQIQYSPILLPLHECKMDSMTAYAFILQYLEQNMNSKNGIIDRGYHWKNELPKSFTLKKYIKLVSPVTYKEGYYKTMRSKKMSYREAVRVSDTFDIATISYHGSTDKADNRVPEFVGKNYEDMMKQIKDYADDILERMNAPISYCPHCNGTGIIDERTR